MSQITAKQVKELREITNVGMMECKKALQETAGDLDEAIKYLRERGMAIAAKKADRAANEGLIASDISADSQSGTMIEVNCETDFVAKNDNFGDFVTKLSRTAHDHADGTLAEAVTEEMTAKITEIGENLQIGRNLHYTVEGTGALATYIHLGGKVGVVAEFGCEKAETINEGAFKEVCRDVCMHVAALNPTALNRDGVDAGLIEAEKAVYAKQVEGKPENIIEKILVGKIEKFYSQICLVEQGFVKDPDQSVSDLLAAVGKGLGDTLTVRRYTRYQIGA